MLLDLISDLQESYSILNKRDIQVASQYCSDQTSILLGDDCAAIPDGDGYLLLATEGISPSLVQTNPWFAGWCSVLVNVSDIYAMAGRPLAVVDALWSQSEKTAQLLWEGMIAASKALNVPIVGGHTNCHSPYEALSVAILGRAKHLISSFQAQPEDILVFVTDLEGKPHPQFSYCWDAATEADSNVLQRKLNLLPELAEKGLCDAGKDVSMGGIVGTALMLLETSGCGGILDLDAIPCPPVLSLKQWLLSFPSYGFLLSVRPHCVDEVQSCFQSQGLTSAAVGQVTLDPVLKLKSKTESRVFWDLKNKPLTGFKREVKI